MTHQEHLQKMIAMSNSLGLPLNRYQNFNLIREMVAINFYGN